MSPFADNMAELEEDEMDLDTLQAQIDMSMAFTQELVSGWMKASKAKLPSSSSKLNEEKELEELMRRPQRLGVGASVPEATSILSRETAKLRNKLVGNGKKRAREDDETPKPTQPIVISDDDDEDSRARVITKKARVDPFAPKQKQKKKGNAKTLQALVAAARSASPSKEDAPQEVVSQQPPGANSFAENGLVPTASSKRKRKKKHKAHGDGPPPPEASHTAASVAHKPLQTAASGSEKRDTIVLEDTPPPIQFPSKSSPSKPHPGRSLPHHRREAPPPARPPPSPATQASRQLLDPFGMPLLNLAGPPPDTGGDALGSPKKKRKKKKKKKKNAASEVPANAEVIDVDAEGDEG